MAGSTTNPPPNSSASTPLLDSPGTQPTGNTFGSDSTVIPVRVGPPELLTTRTIPAKYTPRMSMLLLGSFILVSAATGLVIGLKNPFHQDPPKQAWLAGLGISTVMAALLGLCWNSLNRCLIAKYGLDTYEITARPLTIETKPLELNLPMPISVLPQACIVNNTGLPQTDFWAKSAGILMRAFHTDGSSSATSTTTATTHTTLTMSPLTGSK